MHLGTPIAKGNTAEVYLCNNKIIKVFNDYLPDTESIKEANKQKYAYSCGLPVPKVLDVTIIAGKQAIIMEYAKGETLADLYLKDKNKAVFYLTISVEVQQEIHNIIPIEIESMHDKLSRQIQAVNSLDKRLKSHLIRKLESMTFENRLCHGDFHLYNLIKTENQVVVIDWVDASSGDIRADVYRTYLIYSQYSIELAELHLKIYCDKSGLVREEIFQWAPIIAAARLSEHVTSDHSERLMEIINKLC
ncbi:aminoglycoside phosphotransferase family protein [Metabacillus malikii]|uniref:RIO-like serine/threonine protein kinase n=1 Tax=Metabacillus malikii TaxID=1504265 RepID=A0ABT9ZK05_9BACI|nr:aminoglycoside phosphotransferase family protein [Metabacillus malikii]MDQ0232632.1 RIO-like serine/threonine protein kinase [Metabacillus malikii]